jgi:c-di-GMP-related signal transduction protein
MENALITYEGDMGKVLDTVINYQNGHWDRDHKIPFVNAENIKPDDITQAYLDSVQWAEKHNEM